MRPLTVGGLFDGIGLLALGLHLAGLEHRWLCEVDPWRRSKLERLFPGAPVIEDVRAVSAVRCERVDVIAGGWPCKGNSTAGRRTGLGHPETALWHEFARVVGELRPRYVLVENVANVLAIHDGAVWGTVLGDLASLGYVGWWDCLPAAAFGAPHLRDRVFAVAAHADAERESGLQRGTRTELAVAGVDRRVATHAGGNGVREQSEPEPGRGGPAVARRAGAAPPDAGGIRWERRAGQQGEGWSPAIGREEVDPAGDSHPSPARGVAVEWGDYEPAIRRWEAVHGRAPEPLVRRVDDRSAARVERSRLSALGDGVQVQAGRLVGEWLMELASTQEAA